MKELCRVKEVRLCQLGSSLNVCFCISNWMLRYCDEVPIPYEVFADKTQLLKWFYNELQHACYQHAKARYMAKILMRKYGAGLLEHDDRGCQDCEPLYAKPPTRRLVKHYFCGRDRSVYAVITSVSSLGPFNTVKGRVCLPLFDEEVCADVKVFVLGDTVRLDKLARRLLVKAWPGLARIVERKVLQVLETVGNIEVEVEEA